MGYLSRYLSEYLEHPKSYQASLANKSNPIPQSKKMSLTMPKDSIIPSPEAVTFQGNVNPPPPPDIASSPITTLKSPDTRRMNRKSDARAPTIHTKKVARFCQFLSAEF